MSLYLSNGFFVNPSVNSRQEPFFPNFQDNEIEQVTQIIDNAQAQIQAIKDSLIGSNIITDKEVGKNPKEILENAEKRIDMITQNMQRAIPEKVQWIINNRFISE